MSDVELRAIKEKITKYTNPALWHLLEGREGVLIYSDKRGLNLSKATILSEYFSKHVTQQ
jgi:hypothetical protein